MGQKLCCKQDVSLVYRYSPIQKFLKCLFFCLTTIKHGKMPNGLAIATLANSKRIYPKTRIRGNCVSGVEQASCYQKVVGSIPLVCMWKCPWARYPPQTVPDVLVGTLHGSHRHHCLNVCINCCKSLWTEASDKCLKCKCKCKNASTKYCTLELAVEASAYGFTLGQFAR